MTPKIKPTIPRRELTDIEKLSMTLTRWVGSTKSLVAHSIFFAFMLLLAISGVGFDKVLLILTTVVSLEAIYLSIFIQMSVNRQSRKLRAVSKDIEEIQADVEEISEDVEEIQKDVEEIQEDVEEIGEEVEEWSEEDEVEEKKEARERKSDLARLNRIEESLEILLAEIKTQKATSKQRNALKDSKKK
jgi:uncharacterized membrane protein